MDHAEAYEDKRQREIQGDFVALSPYFGSLFLPVKYTFINSAWLSIQ
jgi:hypothetical protein